MREIHFYRKASGDCPVEQFLDGLGPKQAQKVAWVLQVVRELPLVPKLKALRLRSGNLKPNEPSNSSKRESPTPSLEVGSAENTPVDGSRNVNRP